MQITYSLIYLLLIIALAACTVYAKRSSRQSRGAVAWLETSLMIPILGSIIIIMFDTKALVLIGYYIYFLGINGVLLASVNFTNAYCNGIGNGTQKPTIMYIGIVADTVQLLLNPFLEHAFRVESDGGSFKLVTQWGLTLHRVIDYIVLICVVLIFTLASVLTPKIYRGKYTVLLASIITIGLMQAYFIYTGSNYDRSVIGYAIFGIVIFYFAIIYRPLRLLDRMLSSIVSDLSDAFYIFDSTGKCIWANEQGCVLAGFSGKNYEELNALLESIIGIALKDIGASCKMPVGEGEDAKFYLLEEKQVIGEGGKNEGSYLRIQDITEEEHEIRERDKQIGQISQEAYKDALTGVGNKAAYNNKVNELNSLLENGLTDFAVVMVDMNDLKHINDEYGHKSGDLYIKGCCHMICETFKFSPVFRIGGDEFVVILQGQDFDARFQKVQQLRSAYEQAYEQTDQDPWLRYCAAVGLAELASDDNSFELVFKRADKAMYEEKKQFKTLHGSYRK